MKAKNCLENLGICKASCCKVVTFTVRSNNPNTRFFTLPSRLSKDMQYYYKLRGLVVKRLPSRAWSVQVPESIKVIRGKKNDSEDLVSVYATCKELTRDNLCGLHGSDRKPFVCKALDESTARNGLFQKTEGCIYFE